jgi:hypothetical protein
MVESLLTLSKPPLIGTTLHKNLLRKGGLSLGEGFRFRPFLDLRAPKACTSPWPNGLGGRSISNSKGPQRRPFPYVKAKKFYFKLIF